MKKYLLLLTIVAISTTFAQKNLTLEEAIQIALQRNVNLIKYQNSLESASKNVKSQYGNLLPNFGASGSWGWSRSTDKGGIQVDPFTNEEVIFPASTTDSRSWSVSAGGGITLFNGLANYASIAQAENDLEAAEYDLEKLKQDIVEETANLYYTVLNADALLKVREENVKYNQKFFETVDERNKLGAVPIADVYSQQVQLGNAELLYIQAQNELDLAKNNLLNYLALDVLEDYNFVDPFASQSEIDTELHTKDFGAISALVAEALGLRLDYKSQLLSVESADKGITVSKSGLFPTLSGNYGFSTSATVPDNLFDRKTYSVGLSLNIPIFSNWNTEYQIELATVQYKNAQEDLQALERQIKIEVKQGYLDLLAAKKSLEVARKNVTAAEETRRINYERYSLGSGTILDVLQADRDYTDALRNRINAKYNFLRAKDNLMNALGKLEYKSYEN